MRFALQLIAISFWLVLCLLFSGFVLSNFWPAIAGIPGALVLLVFALRRSKSLYSMWLAGTPTVFIYANNLLDSIPFLRVERAFLPLFLLGLFSTAARQRDAIKSLLPIEQAMMALLVVATVSVLTTSAGESSEIIRQNAWLLTESMIVPYFGFYLARRQDWSAKDVDVLITWLLIAGLYLAIVGALQLFLGMSFFFPHYIAPPGESDRATGVFSSSNEYGLVMIVLLFLAIYRFVRCDDGIMRTLHLGAMAVALAGLAICKTRAPWLGAFAGLVSVYVGDRRVRPLMNVGAALLTVGFLAALPFLDESGLLENRILDLEPMYPRFAAYTTALNIIVQHPLTGLGFGPMTFSLAKPEYGTTFGLISTNWILFASVPHNEYLHMMVLMGLAGFVPFVLLLRGAFRVTSRSASHTRSSEAKWITELAVYARGILITYVIACLFVDIIIFHYFLTLMYFFLGLSASDLTPDDVRPRGASVFRRR